MDLTHINKAEKVQMNEMLTSMQSQKDQKRTPNKLRGLIKTFKNTKPEVMCQNLFKKQKEANVNNRINQTTAGLQPLKIGLDDP